MLKPSKSRPESLQKATIPLEEYSMKACTAANPIPCGLPFIGDFCSALIPDGTKLPAWSAPACHKGKGGSVMHDIIESIRQETKPHTFEDGVYYLPPTTTEIQKYMSVTWPEKYPQSVPDAKGWKNSVNQCLTHGQGWNFVTYDPLEGKNKRDLLVERAFNGVCVLGSGQCNGLNDKKPKTSPTIGRATPRKQPISQPCFFAPQTLSFPLPPSTSSSPSPIYSTSSSSTTSSTSNLYTSPPVPFYSGILSSTDLSPIQQADIAAEWLSQPVPIWGMIYRG
jgi:hypothetical protein